MLKKFWDWLTALFRVEPAEPPPFVETFGGVIKDDVDPRDHIFGAEEEPVNAEQPKKVISRREK